MVGIVNGIAMRTFFRIALIAALLSSLSACVVVPAPYYGYGPYYGHHHEYYRNWDQGR
jgi:hypothetical protein